MPFSLLPLNAKPKSMLSSLPMHDGRASSSPDADNALSDGPAPSVAVQESNTTGHSSERVDSNDHKMQAIFKEALQKNAPAAQNAVKDAKTSDTQRILCPASHMVATIPSPDVDEIKTYVHGLRAPAICLMGEPVHSIFSAAIAHVHGEWSHVIAFACPHVSSFEIFCNKSSDDTIQNMVRIPPRQLRMVSNVADAMRLLTRLFAEASLERRVWTRAEWLDLPKGRPVLCVDLDEPDRQAMDMWQRAQEYEELYTVDASASWVKEIMPVAGFYVKQAAHKALAATVEFE